VPREHAPIPDSALVPVEHNPREVLTEAARELRVILEGWPESRRGVPRHRYVEAQLRLLERALAREPE
jgi:hypothetical protein